MRSAPSFGSFQENRDAMMWAKLDGGKPRPKPKPKLSKGTRELILDDDD